MKTDKLTGLPLLPDNYEWKISRTDRDNYVIHIRKKDSAMEWFVANSKEFEFVWGFFGINRATTKTVNKYLIKRTARKVYRTWKKYYDRELAPPAPKFVGVYPPNRL